MTGSEFGRTIVNEDLYDWINFLQENGVGEINLFDIKKSKDNKSNYLILTNYQSENNNDIFNSQYEFLKNYKILYRKNNCYLLKSND